nr:zinc finger protein 287-like [Aedes albopictus]
MGHQSSTSPANLCRVCIRDITYVPAENIFYPSSPDCLSIHAKLSAICSELFAPDQRLSLADGTMQLMPLRVCLRCKSRINEAYELHQLCLDNNRKIMQMLEIVKEEPVDEIQTEPTREQLPENSVECPSEAVKESEKLPVKLKSTSVRKGGQKSRKISCKKCSAVKINARAMLRHMKLEHPDELLHCSKVTGHRCNRVYYDQAKLDEHIVVHSQEKKCECPNCKKLFKTPREVRVHLTSCTGQKPYLCTECGKAFSYAVSLKNHLMLHKEKAYACDRCPSKFRQKGALKCHMLTHEKIRNFHCDTCGAAFIHKNNLVNHMTTHTGEKPYACDLCPMRFRTLDSMRRHFRTHTGEKPYKCTHCDRTFAQTNDLAKHSKIHFGDNPYKCEMCDAAFRLLSDLRNHYKVHYEAGGSQNQNHLPEEVRFTIVSTLNRRAEQEKDRKSQQQVDTTLNEQIQSGENQTIPADHWIASMGMENKI